MEFHIALKNADLFEKSLKKSRNQTQEGSDEDG